MFDRSNHSNIALSPQRQQQQKLIASFSELSPTTASELAASIAVEFGDRLVYTKGKWQLDGRELHPITLRGMLIDAAHKYFRSIKRALITETAWWLQLFLHAEDH